MPKVNFVKEKQEIEVPVGGNLRDEAIKAGIIMNYHFGSSTMGKLNCRGHGLCGTCFVLIKKGMENLGPKTGVEKFKLALMIAPIGHEEEGRLACQAIVNGDCTVETNPEFNWSGENFWQKPYPNK